MEIFEGRVGSRKTFYFTREGSKGEKSNKVVRATDAKKKICFNMKIKGFFSQKLFMKSLKQSLRLRRHYRDALKED